MQFSIFNSQSLTARVLLSGPAQTAERKSPAVLGRPAIGRAHWSADRSPRTGGFTLVELMVVISIITIFAAAIVPTFARSLRGTSLDMASRNLVDVFKYAYASAVTRGVGVRVCFDLQENLYWLEGEATELDAPDAFEPVSVPGNLPLRFGSAVRVSFQMLSETSEDPGSADFCVMFYPDGTADEVEIVLSNRDGDEHVVFVSGVTGRAWVQGDEPDADYP